MDERSYFWKPFGNERVNSMFDYLKEVKVL